MNKKTIESNKESEEVKAMHHELDGLAAESIERNRKTLITFQDFERFVATNSPERIDNALAHMSGEAMLALQASCRAMLRAIHKRGIPDIKIAILPDDPEIRFEE